MIPGRLVCGAVVAALVVFVAAVPARSGEVAAGSPRRDCEEFLAETAAAGLPLRLDCAALPDRFDGGPAEQCALLADAARAENVLISCAVEDEEEPRPEPVDELFVAGAPLPIERTVDGRAGCVTGDGRPVVDTVAPRLTARYDVRPTETAKFEFQEMDGESIVAVGAEAENPAVHEFEPGDLGPGLTYRWRVRVTADDAPAPGWSSWCEFALDPGLPDLRGVEDADAVRELGLRPERAYTVHLTSAQRRLVLEALEADPEIEAAVRRSPVTMDGARWASAARALAERAAVQDESARTEGLPVDGTATRAVLDLISRRLGGPAHPVLGFLR